MQRKQQLQKTQLFKNIIEKNGIRNKNKTRHTENSVQSTAVAKSFENDISSLLLQCFQIFLPDVTMVCFVTWATQLSLLPTARSSIMLEIVHGWLEKCLGTILHS